MFKRRVGSDPHSGGTQSPASPGCPDIWELETGEFLVIGRDATDELRSQMPADVSCGPEERMVVVPRSTFINAKNDIPTK